MDSDFQSSRNLHWFDSSLLPLLCPAALSFRQLMFAYLYQICIFLSRYPLIPYCACVFAFRLATHFSKRVVSTLSALPRSKA